MKVLNVLENAEVIIADLEVNLGDQTHSSPTLCVRYDELCKRVNDAYRENPDIRIRTLANNLEVPFDVVWESIGFKDWFAFYETRDGG